MSINDNKLSELVLKLQKESNNLSKHKLYDLTFNYGINENEIIELMVKVAKYLSYASCGMGTLSVLIGIFATFYDQGYLAIFALVCILHLTLGPFAYLAFGDGRRVMFALLAVTNQLWIGLAIIYFTTYIFVRNDNSFNHNIMHHFLFVLYLLTSIALQIVYVIIAIKLIICFEQKISALDEPKRQI